jgi:hypothetical protein
VNDAAAFTRRRQDSSERWNDDAVEDFADAGLAAEFDEICGASLAECSQQAGAFLDVLRRRQQRNAAGNHIINERVIACVENDRRSEHVRQGGAARRCLRLRADNDAIAPPKPSGGDGADGRNLLAILMIGAGTVARNLTPRNGTRSGTAL